MLLAVRTSSYGCTWEVWRALKKLELLSAAPRATLTLLSCSPNFPHASITRCTHAKHEPIVKYIYIYITGIVTVVTAHMCARIFTVERLTLPISVYIVTALAALTKSFTNKDEISASLISSIFVVLYAFFWRKDRDK